MKFLVPLLFFVSVSCGQEITKEDIRKTVEHMQQLAKDSEARADNLQKENDALAMELTDTATELAAAQLERVLKQKEVDAITEDRNKQADLAKYWSDKQKEAVKKLWWWRIWGWSAIILGVLIIAGGLILKFTKWGAGVTSNVASKLILS